MDIRRFHGRWARVGVSCLWLAFFAPRLDAQTVGPESREEARDFLRSLVRTEEGEQRVAAALASLDAEEYPERIRATRALLREPAMPEDLVEQAMRGGSVDLRLRLEQIVAFHAPGRLETLLVATFHAISEQAWEGFAPDILVALDGRSEQDGRLWQVAVSAMRVTVRPGDEEALRMALGSSTALVRGAAMAGLAEGAGAAAREAIAALSRDPNDLVVFQVAEFLRGLKDRRCVPAYVALLDAEDFSLRWQAGQALRALTGKTFGYEAGERGTKRWIALLSWRSWLKTEAGKAELSFEEAVEQAVVLFDGLSLAGWREVGAEGAPGWAVEEGNLVCTGLRNARGYLRTEGAYRDYRLSLEYRLPNGAGDSGLGLFMAGVDVAMPPCLEIQLLSGKTGDLYRIGAFEAKDGEGRPIQFQKAREGDAVERPGDWNLLECVVMDGTLEVRLNGTVVNRASDCPKEEGMINLRNEGDRVEFRNLLLTPIQP